jgi:hypothetical protein
MFINKQEKDQAHLWVVVVHQIKNAWKEKWIMSIAKWNKMIGNKDFFKKNANLRTQLKNKIEWTKLKYIENKKLSVWSIVFEIWNLIIYNSPSLDFAFTIPPRSCRE